MPSALGLSVFATIMDESSNEISDEVPLSSSPGTALHPALAYAGTEIGAAWSQVDASAHLEIMFGSLSADLSPLGQPVAVTSR